MTKRNGTGNDDHSLSDYARHRGCSTQSVSRAVKKKRLSKSVARTSAGQPRITSFDLTDEEWRANTDFTKAPIYVREREVAREKAALPSARALRPDGTGVAVPTTPYEITALEDVSVVVLSGPDVDQVAICVIQDDDAQPVLVVDKNTAANLALKLWIEAGGQVEDLPGVKPRADHTRNRDGSPTGPRPSA